MNYEDIPFDDNADEVQTWKGLALSAIADMRRYADDDLAHRRWVSVEAYEADAIRLAEKDAERVPYHRAAFMNFRP